MSLLHLVHKSVFIKFAEAAKSQFNPETSYAFRLTAVDAMGFLCLQELKHDTQAGHEAAAEPYWINKDLIREIHEVDPTAKVTPPTHGQSAKSHDNGQTSKSHLEAAIEQVHRETTPKPGKAKNALKPKSALKQKSAFN